MFQTSPMPTAPDNPVAVPRPSGTYAKVRLTHIPFPVVLVDDTVKELKSGFYSDAFVGARIA